MLTKLKMTNQFHRSVGRTINLQIGEQPIDQVSSSIKTHSVRGFPKAVLDTIGQVWVKVWGQLDAH